MKSFIAWKAWTEETTLPFPCVADSIAFFAWTGRRAAEKPEATARTSLPAFSHAKTQRTGLPVQRTAARTGFSPVAAFFIIPVELGHVSSAHNKPPQKSLPGNRLSADFLPPSRPNARPVSRSALTATFRRRRPPAPAPPCCPPLRTPKTRTRPRFLPDS